MYSYWLTCHRDDPSQQTFWRTELFERLWNQPPWIRNWSPFDGSLPVPTASEIGDDLKAGQLEAWCLQFADDTLDVHDLTVDEPSRLKLAKAVAAAVQRASLTLARWAKGE